MTESTMVERVARALYARRPNGHGSVILLGPNIWLLPALP